MNHHPGRFILLLGAAFLLGSRSADAQEYYRSFGSARSALEAGISLQRADAVPWHDAPAISPPAEATDSKGRPKKMVRIGLRDLSAAEGIVIGFRGNGQPAGLNFPKGAALRSRADAERAIWFSRMNRPLLGAGRDSAEYLALIPDQPTPPAVAPVTGGEKNAPDTRTEHSAAAAKASAAGAGEGDLQLPARANPDAPKMQPAQQPPGSGDAMAQRSVSPEKIAEIEKRLANLQTEIVRADAVLDLLRELGEAGKRAEEKRSGAQKQIADLLAEVRQLSGGGKLPANDASAANPPPIPEAGIPKPPANEPAAAAAAPPVQPSADLPAVPPDAGSAPLLPHGTTANSLGMKFVPVGSVQFSVFLTTVKDFEAFATATKLKSEAWKTPGFKQGPDHPVVNVTWREADAFCKWLTEKEHKSGKLKTGESYRLPTDLEWSKAVGLPAESGPNPQSRDMGVQDVYPWGSVWPPPAGAGNYAGEETQMDVAIAHYNDGYPNTSPVGKFRMNAAGLYDMGGNVWQWVSDYWNGENRAKTLRGGSWYNGAIPLSLLSSCRISSSPDTLHDTYGFRIVKAADSGKSKRKN